MSGTLEEQTGIKRLEKKKGRLWGFMLREAPGKVKPLSPTSTAGRLRHLMMSTIKTTSSFLKSKMGENGPASMFEHQANEFASRYENRSFRADMLAKNTIRFNFQPLGAEASYSGDAEAARIVVERCPLPQRFLNQPEFLEQITFDQKPLIEMQSADTLTGKGEWPPKRIEPCSMCKILMPRIGEKLGFKWESGLTKDTPPRCFFTITVNREK